MHASRREQKRNAKAASAFTKINRQKCVPNVHAWRVKPTWYQVSSEDRTINPELERFLAKRMKATTIELESSQVSLLSHPKEIADLIPLAAGHEKSQCHAEQIDAINRGYRNNRFHLWFTSA